MKTYGELLTETQTAISTILDGGQEYDMNGRRLRRGDLQWLYERERELMKKVDLYGASAYPGSAATKRRVGVSFS